MATVDVGGTFTDVLLINSEDGTVHTAKVPSTPEDSSIGVLNGIQRACGNADVGLTKITQVTHGTTVATNAVLTGRGALVGLVTTRGYRQILQIARSFVPGGLGGWVVYNKSEPMAPLECTVEVPERIGADGSVVEELDEAATRLALKKLKAANIEALTISLINSFNNPINEQKVAELAAGNWRRKISPPCWHRSDFKLVSTWTGCSGQSNSLAILWLMTWGGARWHGNSPGRKLGS